MMDGTFVSRIGANQSAAKKPELQKEEAMISIVGLMTLLSVVKEIVRNKAQPNGDWYSKHQSVKRPFSDPTINGTIESFGSNDDSPPVDCHVYFGSVDLHTKFYRKRFPASFRVWVVEVMDVQRASFVGDKIDRISAEPSELGVYPKSVCQRVVPVVANWLNLRAVRYEKGSVAATVIKEFSATF